jgi:hypothetical protein
MAVTPGSIAVTPGTGIWLDTTTFLNASGQLAQREVVVLGSPDAASGTVYAIISASGAIRVDNWSVAGVVIDVNSGNKGPGTQRFVIATDQPSLINPIPVSGSFATNTGAPNITGAQILIDTSPDVIVSARPTRRSVLIVNHSTTDVFIMNSTVNPTAGVLLLGVKGASITIPTTSEVRGICASGSALVSYLETYD